jgi:hypothetical protein
MLGPQVCVGSNVGVVISQSVNSQTVRALVIVVRTVYVQYGIRKTLSANQYSHPPIKDRQTHLHL